MSHVPRGQLATFPAGWQHGLVPIPSEELVDEQPIYRHETLAIMSALADISVGVQTIRELLGDDGDEWEEEAEDQP